MAFSMTERLLADAARERMTHSFELFPPRDDAAALALGRTIDRLAATDPAFFSVTFGAGGSNRDRSLMVLRYILRHTHVPPLGHLTAVGSSIPEATERIREFLHDGIRDFLALRGDPPQGGPDDVGAFGGAAELVRLIQQVASSEPDAAEPGRPPTVAVAAFPNGHPRQASRWSDIEALLEKQSIGAAFAITQVFFRADDYLEYVARARAAGVTIPILPGIAPITLPARLHRLSLMNGEPAPAEFELALGNAASREEARAIGIEFTVDLAVEVLKGGAPSAHYFTFNDHESTLRIHEQVRAALIGAA